jgi:hypothetical protein
LGKQEDKHVANLGTWYARYGTSCVCLPTSDTDWFVFIGRKCCLGHKISSRLC